jgi:hypothetical protein
MFKAKKSLLSVAVIASTLGLTACGGSSNDSTPPAPPANRQILLYPPVMFQRMLQALQSARYQLPTLTHQIPLLMLLTTTVLK